MPNKRSKVKKTNQTIIWNITETIWDNDTFYFRTIVSYLYQTFVRLEKKVLFVRKYAFDVSIVIFMLTIGTYIFFPAMVSADTEDPTVQESSSLSLMVSAMQNNMKDYGRLPVAKDALARRTFNIPITAYTSDIAQTDETPCITASGLNLCKRNTEDIVAANFLPIGTRIRIPELYGDQIFYVQDRMNARYNRHVDIWMKDYGDAKQFGLKMTKIEVF